MAGLQPTSPALAPAGIALSGTAPSERTPSGIIVTTTHLERSSAKRADQEWLDAAWADPRTRVLVVHQGKALARVGGGAAELVYLPPERAPEGVRFLLGTDADGVAYFGVGAPLTAAGAGGARPAGLREAGLLLSGQEAGLLTHATALANWHATAAFCPRCGSATEIAMAGHSRRCPADGSEHFPRSDPAVIMLVTDSDDRCLLARNVEWPQRRFSVLAGFVEPGESAERAVAREVLEETGVLVSTVSYAGSQPWPMPHSLMLGFRAQATGTQIKVDADEIAEAYWYSRADLKSAVESGEVLMSPSLSISRWLIETWYGPGLPGS